MRSVRVTSKRQQFFKNLSKGVLCFFIFYFLVVILVAYSKTLQGLILYGNWIKRPYLKRLWDLKAFGIGHHARNIKIETADGITLGAWHLLPTTHPGILNAAAAVLQGDKEKSSLIYKHALEEPNQKVIIYFHGQAATRGMPSRVELCRSLATLLGFHVISFDYRGFGDSTGWPSEEGLAADSLGVWDWTVRHIHPSSQVFLYGQSLGTHMATKLVFDLQTMKNDFQPAGLILDAPFKNMRTAALYHPAALIFRPFPIVKSFLVNRIKEDFATDTLLPYIKCPAIIFHGSRDKMIPVTVSESLYSHVKREIAAVQIGENKMNLVNISLKIIDQAGHKNIGVFSEWLIYMHNFTSSRVEMNSYAVCE